MRQQRRAPARIPLLLAAAALALFANLAGAVTATTAAPARAQEKATTAPVAPVSSGGLAPALTPSASTPTGTTNAAPAAGRSESPANPAAAPPVVAVPAPVPVSPGPGSPVLAPPAVSAAPKPAAPASSFTPAPAASSPAVVPSPAAPAALAVPPIPAASTSPVVPAISQVPTTGTAPVFSAPTFDPAPITPVVEQPAFEPGQILVLWSGDQAAASGISTMQERYQLRPRQRYVLGNLGFVLAMYMLPNERAASFLRDQLRTDQPDWTVDLNARSALLQSAERALGEKDFPRLYAAKMLGDTANPAHFRPDSPSLRVGVIDTGVDGTLAQPGALNGSILKIRSVLGPGDKPGSTAHGNAVLQLMVGASNPNGFSGYAPPLLVSWVNAMRELNAITSTNSLMLSLALDWLAGEHVTLINMSLGGQGDEILKKVIARVLEKNVTIVAAVGNNPARPSFPVYPAAYPGVWAIAAVDATGRLHGQGSHASYTVLAAPGAELWVPSDQPHLGGSYVSGTSYATALASATVAWQPPDFWALSAMQRRVQVCVQARKLQDHATAGCGLVQKNLH